MGRFKVGDQVRIKENLIVKTHENGVRFTKGMKKYKGKSGKVLAINTKGYRLDIDGREWNWSDGMLEKHDNTYTGIELLQAIKDGVFKQGDRFDIVDEQRDDLKAAIFIDTFYGVEIIDNRGTKLRLSTIIHSKFKPIINKPVKKDPIDKIQDIIKAYGETLMNGDEYKSLPDALSVLSKIYNKLDNAAQEEIRNIIFN